MVQPVDGARAMRARWDATKKMSVVPNLFCCRSPPGTFSYVEFGAAWKRTSERGQEFLSASIDDPSLPAPLNAAPFPSEDGETASLVWSRSKAKAKAKTTRPTKKAA
jgi:uncharacterized protein DUF736